MKWQPCYDVVTHTHISPINPRINANYTHLLPKQDIQEFVNNTISESLNVVYNNSENQYVSFHACSKF
jgi:hypothetical protein